MNFVVWLLKRLGKVLIYGPSKVYRLYLEMMYDEWILASFLTACVWVAFAATIGIATNNSLYVIYWTLFVILFVIISIIIIQYQIYRAEVARTMDQLKRKSHDF